MQAIPFCTLSVTLTITIVPLLRYNCSTPLKGPTSTGSEETTALGTHIDITLLHGHPILANQENMKSGKTVLKPPLHLQLGPKLVSFDAIQNREN
jgi:hypothetical protein